MNVRWLVMLVLFCVLPVQGQDARESEDEEVPGEAREEARQTEGFELTPFQLQIGHDSGFLVRRGQMEDNILKVIPAGLTFARITPRSQFIAAYEPEFELFQEFDQLNAWNHAAGATFDFNATRRLTFSTGGTFLATQDPTRGLGTLLLLPRDDSRESSAFVNFAYLLGRMTTLNVRADNTITKISLPLRLLDPVLEEMINTGTVSLTRAFDRFQGVAVSYSYIQPTLLDFPQRRFRFEILNNPFHNAELSYFYNHPYLLVHLSAGVAYSNFSDDLNLRDNLSYVFSARLEKRFSTMELSGGYARHLSFLGSQFRSSRLRGTAPDFVSGNLPTSFSDVLDLTLRGRLGRRFGLQVGGILSFTELERRDEDRRTLSGHVRADYRLAERLVLFTQAEFYDQNLHDFLDRPVSRQRFFGGIQVLLNSSTHPEHLMEQSERLRSVLGDSSTSPLWVDTRTERKR